MSTIKKIIHNGEEYNVGSGGTVTSRNLIDNVKAKSDQWVQRPDMATYALVTMCGEVGLSYGEGMAHQIYKDNTGKYCGCMLVCNNGTCLCGSASHAAARFIYSFFGTIKQTIGDSAFGYVEMLIVGGGGGSGVGYTRGGCNNAGGGGGAGGYCYEQGFSLECKAYSVLVGKGGEGGQCAECKYNGCNGCPSRFKDSMGIINVCVPGGGGGGGTITYGGNNGNDGASGGGGGHPSCSGSVGAGGKGIQGLGNNGGTYNFTYGGGGGGAGGPGSCCSGGAGCVSCITGSNVTYAQGGAGYTRGQTIGFGDGAPGIYNSVGRKGGDGIVVVRYKSDGSRGIKCATGGNIYTCDGYTIHCFTSDGVFVPTFK